MTAIPGQRIIAEESNRGQSLISAFRPLASTVQGAALPGDVQYVLALNHYDQWIGTLVWQRLNDQVWMLCEFDLGIYAGRTIRLHSGAYNDGSDGVTAMYVDDVSLEVCVPTIRRLSQGQSGIDVLDAYWIKPTSFLRSRRGKLHLRRGYRRAPSQSVHRSAVYQSGP